MTIDRRTFLIGVGGTVAAAVAAERTTVRLRRQPVLDWAAHVAGPPSTHNLGLEYLTQHPAEADRDVLLGHLAGLVSLSALVGGPARAVAGFNERLRRDFAEGDVVRMGGWMLSRTELRLCALVAVDANARTGSTGVFAPEPVGDNETVYWMAPQATFALPPALPELEFRLRTGSPDPQHVSVRLDGETVDELTVWGGEWQRVRYVLPRADTPSVTLALATTPAWEPYSDFRTMGVGIDRVWAPE